MDIRQLLAALVREQHLTRAAQACNVTQSGIPRHPAPS